MKMIFIDDHKKGICTFFKNRNQRVCALRVKNFYGFGQAGQADSTFGNGSKSRVPDADDLCTQKIRRKGSEFPRSSASPCRKRRFAYPLH